MDNIQKLREKVDRDPKSTVFVRLADELKRAGRVDEAVEVLKTGIENQPGYMSARVALGKIFMEKEMADEAKAEFMQVVEAVPDNLFARKKLAEIYRSEGDVELALEHYKQYLSMSPQDEEVQAICAELENAPVPQANRGKSAKEEPLDASERPSPLQAGGTATAAPAPAGQPTAEKVPEEADIDAEDVYLETSPYEEDEAEGFLSTLTDKDVEAETVNADEVSLSLRDKEGDTSGHGVEFKGFELEGGETPDTMGQSDVDSMIEDVAGVPDEQLLEFPPAEASGAEEASGGEDTEVVAQEEDATNEPVGVVELSEDEAGMGPELECVTTGGEDEPSFGVVEIPEEDTDVELEGFTEAEPEVQAEPEAAQAVPHPTAEAAPAVSLDEQFAEADALVEQEEYGKALGVYRRLLDTLGDDPEVRQRADELHGLIKFLGREHEIIEARLLAFLESLQRKKHEFFGSS